MSQVLVIDIGNSRMKWGIQTRHGWARLGVTANAEIGTLALRDWQTLARPDRVVGVNVAGEAARIRVEALLARWRVTPEWLTASAAACGVVNSYTMPSQLGADRWAALIAARKRAVAAELFPPPAVVVNAGTAVTVDALDVDGVFRGGVILPGLRLMLRSLAENTSGLKVPPGMHREFPTSTPDALYTGAVDAVCGAIAAMRARVAHGAVATKCYLAGGAAGEIAQHLNDPVEVVDNLVLEGVYALAEAG